MLDRIDIWQKRILVTFIIGLALLFIVRDIGGIGINKYSFLLYCVVFMALAEYESIIYMLCFLMPLFNGLPGTYILLIAVGLMIIKRRSMSKNAILLIALFVCLEIIATFWYTNVDWVEILEYFLFLSIFFIMLYEDSRKDYKLCLDLFFIGVLVFCFVVIISGILTAPSNWMTLFAKGWFRFGETNTGGGSIMMLRGNANELAYFSVSGVAVGLIVIKWKKGIGKVLTAVAISWIMISGFLSLSRSFILVITVLLFIFLLSNVKKPHALVAVIIVFAFAVFGMYKYLSANPELITGFMTRFTDSTMSSGGNRTNIFSRQVHAFMNLPRCIFLGTGVTKYTDILQTVSAHNMLLQIFVCYGLVFGIIFLSAMFRPAFKYKSKGVEYWIPFITVLLFVQTIQFINPYSLMLPYVIAVYSIRVGTI